MVVSHLISEGHSKARFKPEGSSFELDFTDPSSPYIAVK
jgi:hypothetical protein